MDDFKLKIRRGTQAILLFNATNPDGTPADLTGAQMRFVVREDPPAASVEDDTGAAIIKTETNGITFTDAEAGEGEVEIVKADTFGLVSKLYYFDSKVIKAGETEPIPGPAGTLTITADGARGI